MDPSASRTVGCAHCSVAAPVRCVASSGGSARAVPALWRMRLCSWGRRLSLPLPLRLRPPGHRCLRSWRRLHSFGAPHRCIAHRRIHSYHPVGHLGLARYLARCAGHQAHHGRQPLHPTAGYHRRASSPHRSWGCFSTSESVIHTDLYSKCLTSLGVITDDMGKECREGLWCRKSR